jgi:hypothetical protein
MFFSPFPPFSSALTYPFSLGGKCPTPQGPVITPSYSWLAELELKTTDTAEAAVEIRSIYSIQHTLPMAWESNQPAIGNNRIHTSSGYRVHISCYDHRIDLLSKQCNQHRASVPRPEGVDRLPTLLRHRANGSDHLWLLLIPLLSPQRLSCGCVTNVVIGVIKPKRSRSNSRSTLSSLELEYGSTLQMLGADCWPGRLFPSFFSSQTASGSLCLTPILLFGAGFRNVSMMDDVQTAEVSQCFE